MERTGQTEGSIDLVKLAGLTPAAVICEIINEDGTMSRRDDLAIFSKQHGIPMVTISDLIAYRVKHEMLCGVAAKATIPMQAFGDFEMSVYHNQLDEAEHFSLVSYLPTSPAVPLVRVHSECITGDVFGSCKCDCGQQLQQSLAMLSKQGGVLIYLRQEGRGIGLANKLKAYAFQEQGFDTVEANERLGLPVDNRDYAMAYQILKQMGIDTIRLLTNNPAKVTALQQYGINVVERLGLGVDVTPANHSYLKTKQEKLGHFLAIED